MPLNLPEPADVAAHRVDPAFRRHLLLREELGLGAQPEPRRHGHFHGGRDHRLARRLARTPVESDLRVRRFSRSRRRQADGRRRTDHPGAARAVDAIIALIIIGREITISALREWMAQIGEARSVAVSVLGKVKTVSQMLAIPLLLYHDRIGAFDPHRWGTWLIYIAAVLTLVSMAWYLKLSLPLRVEEVNLGAARRCRRNRAACETHIISSLNAGIAQLVERNLAKVEVGSSRLLSRSRISVSACFAILKLRHHGDQEALKRVVVDRQRKEHTKWRVSKTRWRRSSPRANGIRRPSPGSPSGSRC